MGTRVVARRMPCCLREEQRRSACVFRRGTYDTMATVVFTETRRAARTWFPQHPYRVTTRVVFAGTRNASRALRTR